MGDNLTNQEKADALTEQIDAALDDLTLQLAQGHTQGYLDMLAWYSSFHRYSITNAFLIRLQRPNAIQVAGFRKWAELGFTVRKGERGIAIRAPRLKKETNRETGEVEQRLIGYLVTYVFDISQTQEYPEKQPPTIYQSVPGDWDELYQHLKRNIYGKAVNVTEDPMPHGVHGMYSNDHIRINERLEPYHRVTCLIHEYVHHVAHGTADLREGLTRNQVEWEAESVCMAVCRILGFDHEQARDYLLSYKFTTEDLSSSLRKIHTLVKRVLDDLYLLQELPIPKAEAA